MGEEDNRTGNRSGLREEGRYLPGDADLFDMLPGLAMMATGSGRLLRVNKTFDAIFGPGRFEGPECSLSAICMPDDRGKIDRAREEAMEIEEASVTVRLDADREQVCWYHLLINRIDPGDADPMLLVTGSDVTLQERSRQILDNQQAILSSLFRNAGVGMVLLDRNGRILQANHGFTDLFGYEEMEIRGSTIDRLLAPRDEQHEKEKGFTSRAGTAGSSRYRPGVVTRDGRSLAVLVDEVPVTGRNQAELHYRIYTDVTSLEQQRSTALGSVKDYQKLQGDLNHRVMNNLNLATGFLQLQMFETDDPAVRQALTDTVVRIKSLAMVHDIFRDSGSLHQVDMQSYLENLVVFLRQVRDPEGRAELNCQVGEMHMNVERAVPCALLVNELAGAVLEREDAPSPKLSIELSKERSAMLLELRERGDTLERTFGGKDIGDLRGEVVQALLRQLDAEVKWNTRDGVTGMTIRFQADPPARGTRKSWPIITPKK